MLNLRPKNSKKQQPTVAPRPIPPMTSSSAPQQPPSSAAAAAIKKPLRPLTAYHMFFQLEREYIIQTAAGPDADASIHDHKSYLPGVPRKYRETKLSVDWFAGPGKRRKRKHRKSHGKIGFLELSRVISKRWATLDSTDPETKQYVTQIAAGELAEYKAEMEAYKEATKGADAAVVAPSKALSPQRSVSPPASAGRTISPSSSPKPTPLSATSMEYCQPIPSLPTLDLDQDFTLADSILDDDDEIDYSICRLSNNGNYLPSPSPPMTSSESKPDGSINDPLFEWIDGFVMDQPQQPMITTRCVSPVSNEGVNMFDDDDMLQLLSSVRT